MKKGNTRSSYYRVGLALYVAGPARAKSKEQEPRILAAYSSITLPFVPFPGLHLTMEEPRKRGMPLTLYLRVRTVEWRMQEEQFACTVDEMLHANSFDEFFEVRGRALGKEQFEELGETLEKMGFDYGVGKALATIALDKHADGSPKGDICQWRASHLEAPRRRWGGW